jgi:hypothetical protein
MRADGKMWPMTYSSRSSEGGLARCAGELMSYITVERLEAWDIISSGRSFTVNGDTNRVTSLSYALNIIADLLATYLRTPTTLWL